MNRVVLAAVLVLAIGCGDDDPPALIVPGTDTDSDTGTRDTTPDPDTVEDTEPDTAEDIAPDVELDSDEDVVDAPDVDEDTVEDVLDVEEDLFEDIEQDVSDDIGSGVCGDEIWGADEECDGFVFDDCTSFGYEGGELRCGEDCLYDFSLCEGERPSSAVCILEDISLSEGCDGCLTTSCSAEITAAFGSAEWPPRSVTGECEDFFDCLESCLCGDFACEEVCYEDAAFTRCEAALEVAEGCQDENCSLECLCGNGFVDDGENCDPGEGGFIFETCEDLGYEGGTLSCSAECVFDESACEGSRGVCGDGTIDWGLDEECDGPIEETCLDRGYEGGELACTDCSIDISGCELTVDRGDGTCDSPIVFEDVAEPGPGGALVLSDTTVGSDARHVGGCAGEGRELVYTWTPVVDGPHTIWTTIGEDADTVLYVRTSCADAESELSCNDDWDFLDSRVVLSVTSGTTYFVFADTYSLEDAAPFTLSIAPGDVGGGGGEPKSGGK